MVIVGAVYESGVFAMHEVLFLNLKYLKCLKYIRSSGIKLKYLKYLKYTVPKIPKIYS